MRGRNKAKLMFIAAALPLAACEPQPTEAYGGYWDHPQDAEVKVYAMDKCLSAAQGPNSTQYNDWDEAIEACDEFSSGAARYCPPQDMAKCQPQYRRTREDVRSALKAVQP